MFIGIVCTERILLFSSSITILVITAHLLIYFKISQLRDAVNEIVHK